MEGLVMRHKCGRKTEIFSRVVGYFRPVAEWNHGKQEEFKNRKAFSIHKICQKLMTNRHKLMFR
jgi:anaerobic ribonucleoside-triphosphate reductase